MKKTFALLMVLLLALPLAVYAQDATEEMMAGTTSLIEPEIVCPEGEATLRLAGGAVGQELELTQAGAERFQELCPNITVEVIEVPDQATERLNVYLQFFEAQSADVDVVQMDVIWPAILAPHLVDLSQYVSEDYLAQFFPAILENGVVDGSLTSFPWFTDAGLLYYRTDLLEQYGVEVPTTWDELTTAAQTVQDGVRADTGNEEFYGFVWQGNAYEGLTCDAHEWIAAETGEPFITGDGTINVNNEAAIAAVERGASWVGTISPEGVTTYDEEAARGTWQAGNAAFMRNWPYAYSLGNAEESAVAGLFDVAPLPAGASGRGAACLGGWQLGVSRYSANPEAAAALALFLTSPSEQKIRAVEGSYNPTFEALYQDEEVLAANPFFGSLYDVFTTAVPRPSTLTGSRYNDASTLFYEAVHSVLTGQAEAADAMADLEIDLEDLVASLES